MKYSRTTARHRPADELCEAVFAAHDHDWPDVWGRGKFSQLLAWEIRRHRAALAPRGPYRLRVVEVIDWPRADRTYQVWPRYDLERIGGDLGALLKWVEKYDLEVRSSGHIRQRQREAG